LPADVGKDLPGAGLPQEATEDRLGEKSVTKAKREKWEAELQQTRERFNKYQNIYYKRMTQEQRDRVDHIYHSWGGNNIYGENFNRAVKHVMNNNP